MFCPRERDQLFIPIAVVSLIKGAKIVPSLLKILGVKYPYKNLSEPGE